MKKKLIDMEMTQTDLAKEVSKELNLKVDTFYIGNVLAGRRKPKNIMAAIEKITGVSSNSIPV